MNFIPAGHGIVEVLGLKLRTKGILPDEEQNDGLVIAEAGLSGCTILLTADHHMLEAQAHPAFRRTMEESEVPGGQIVIATPRQIVKRFFQKK